MRADKAEAVVLISEQDWGYMMAVKERTDRERARALFRLDTRCPDMVPKASIYLPKLQV